MEIIDWKIMNGELEIKINKGIILYGASGTGEKMVMLLRDLRLDKYIFAIVDSNEKKWGKKWMDYEITSPQIIKNFSDNIIVVITSVYLQEIIKYLSTELNCNKKICSSFSLRHALHYIVMNNGLNYTEKIYIEKYKQKYNLWKQNEILGISNIQQQYFFSMLQCMIENPESILLCAMPKTGNISLAVSLEEEKKTYISFTFHSSYFDNFTLKMVKDVLKHFNKNNIKIISGVREPVERIISHKWQRIRYPYLNNDKCIPILIDNDYDTFIDNLLIHEELSGNKFNCRECIYYDTYNWFKDHIDKVFGINIFDYTFDKNKGYSIIQKGNISIFVYRLDKLDNLEKEIKKFVGENKFKLKKENFASDKKYKFAYSEYLKKVKIERKFFNNLISSKGMTHFYTEEECEKYREKWFEHII